MNHSQISRTDRFLKPSNENDEGKQRIIKNIWFTTFQSKTNKENVIIEERRGQTVVKLNSNLSLKDVAQLD